MPGITDLPTLLARLQPVLTEGEFVFVTRATATYGDGAELQPIAAIVEDEGLTLVAPKILADAAGEPYEGVFRKITLQVYSSLEAVGLTAVVADVLAQHGISANIIAAFHHDHLFVPASRAQDALVAIAQLPQKDGPRAAVSNTAENE
ncbi:MAG: ACT domain-containing protein [bacterium]|nr:ACT domain-containing protein [bacterium]